jgi:hypothetical protein
MTASSQNYSAAPSSCSPGNAIRVQPDTLDGNGPLVKLDRTPDFARKHRCRNADDGCRCQSSNWQSRGPLPCMEECQTSHCCPRQLLSLEILTHREFRAPERDAAATSMKLWRGPAIRRPCEPCELPAHRRQERRPLVQPIVGRG